MKTVRLIPDKKSLVVQHKNFSFNRKTQQAT